ncbi:MAG: DUF917 domain-containing protein [Pirellulaceae bacterium]
MPTRVLHSEQDAEDFLRGLTLLGTGGGGRREVGRRYLLGLLEEGKPIGWTDLDEIPDDAWTCCPFGMGSIAPTAPLSEEERERLGYGPVVAPRPFLQAVRELEAYSGAKISAIVPFELGAVNTSAPLDAAIRLGIHLVDGDYSARAVPELVQTTVAMAGKEMCPAAVADPWGNVLILKGVGSLALAEAIGKSVSIVTKRADPLASCAHAGFLLQAREVKQCIIPGTMTRTLEVGAAIRRAQEAGADPVRTAAKALDGWVIFEGLVVSKDWESREGYMYGTTTIRGDGGFSGEELRIWFKNENHVTWRNGTPYVLAPDPIAVVNRESGEPTTNSDLEAGSRVAVLGARADARQRTGRGLDLLGPKHYGFDLEYVPIEEVMPAQSGER